MSNIKAIVKNQRDYFNKGETKNIDFRISQLKKLKRAILDNENLIFEALKCDLGKCAFESYETEVGLILDEIKYTIKHLSSWSKPKKVKTPITHFLSWSYTYWDPYGVCLIMSPWNYPFQLTLAPLVGSIAAGNCAIIKPSAYSPKTSAIIAKIVKNNFVEEYITVIEGGRDANSALLEEAFDYIFFTGGVTVGKKVMEAASKHVTPITLELGGKSPCIVDTSADLDISAKRLVWGKFLNCGQTCVAPDYLLIHKSIKKEFLSNIQKYIKEFYGNDPINSDDLGCIVNDKHFERLQGLMKAGNIIAGGNVIKEKRKIAPTVIDNITWSDPIMQEEIFGPILPVIEYENLSEVISEINKHPKPLALYFFTKNKENEEIILRDISFGGGCVNDTIVHLATPHMPFGGVGASGMGGYHGKDSFETFSHKKSILKKSLLIDVKLRYAPYNDKLKLLKKILK